MCLLRPWGRCGQHARSGCLICGLQKGKEFSWWDPGRRENGGVRIVPANSGALDPNGDFPMLEILPLLDALKCRSRFGYPELVLRVCEHTDVGQADRFRHGSHGGLVLRTEETGGRGTRRRGQACEGCFFLVREHSGRG